MAVGDVIALLTKHNCADYTTYLDLFGSSQHPIANGGLGDVFKGRLLDGTPVAIKTIRAYGSSENSMGTYQKRAAKEIYTWSKCNHPNVVRLMGLAVFRNSLAMISRWEENRNLLHYLSHNQHVDRCRLSTSICAGLAYLHENEIVHGDLKGDNVLIAGDGTPMLMDFGNASILDATLQFTQTKSGPSFSLRWTAPEILREKTAHTTAGDIYALGMTILEALTAEIPYPNKKDQAVLTMVLNKKKAPARPKKIIPETSIYGNTLWGILKSCWSHNPKSRPSIKVVCHVMTPLTPEMLQEIEDEDETDEDEDDMDQDED
ncbi:kinase-like domain-containing protein [Rhizoctonia solani]|nr:kinase-like domain-containing protein [Rhizoctonia solani]